MAQVSKKGSATVKHRREQKERKRAQNKDWELAGTRIGAIIGMQAQTAQTAQTASSSAADAAQAVHLTATGEVDLRKTYSFADKLGDPAIPEPGRGASRSSASASATDCRKKTLAQQRQSLPIFAVRQQVILHSHLFHLRHKGILFGLILASRLNSLG